MKFTIEQQVLSNALQLLQTVIPARSPVPTLQNVRIEVNDNGIFCTATDLEVATKVQIEGEIEEQGDIMVNCKKLASLVRVLPQSEINFSTTSSDRITLTSKTGRYKLIGMSSDEFPIFADCEGESFIIQGAQLAQVIENTSFAASREEVRYALNAIHFDFTDEHLEVVATDGRKLALVSLKEIKNGKLQNFLLTLSASQEIKKSFAMSESVEVTIADGRLLLTDGRISMVCRSLDAEYVKYGQIISQSTEADNTGSVVLSTQKLLESVQRVSMLCHNQNYGVELEFPEEGQARVFVKSVEYGEGEEDLVVEEQTGSVRIGLHSQYVTQVLSQITEPTVRLTFTTKDMPMIFEPAEEKDRLYLVMPMRLEG